VGTACPRLGGGLLSPRGHRDPRVAALFFALAFVPARRINPLSVWPADDAAGSG
jgi:hypothetical protein